MGRLEVETADHVVLRYDLAGGGTRGFAALVDFIIASFLGFGVLTATALLAAAFGPAVVTTFGGVIALLGLLAIWLYFIVLEWMWNGQTIGKRVFGLRVIGGDGAPAGFVAVLVRNLGRIIDFLPGFYGLGLLVIVLSPRSQRLGDMAAGTYVVR